MIINISIWLAATVISAILYHISGIGGWKGAKLLRRLGCSLIALVLYILLAGFKLSHIWAYVVFWGLNYGALSSYMSELQEPKDDVNWFEWLITGFLYGISAFPLCIASGKWIGFAIRTVILTFGIMLIREKFGSNEIEELGSGALYTATMPLLLI